jgi:ornithine cyclodeaminase/alanine dehydrogenase-like protein (mu-crystallin family)
VLNVHGRGWPPGFTSLVDRISCDDRRQLLDPTGGLTDVYPNLNPDFELGDVVAGQHPGRESSTHTIFSFNYGLAIFDILVADYVLTSM